MITRILGEGQYDVPDQHLVELNAYDSALQQAADADDDAAFGTALRRLLDAVRRIGTPVPDEVITPSDVVLPDAETSLRQVREMLSDEGLVPG